MVWPRRRSVVKPTVDGRRRRSLETAMRDPAAPARAMRQHRGCAVHAQAASLSPTMKASLASDGEGRGAVPVHHRQLWPAGGAIEAAFLASRNLW
jgi:hypothetical protein